MQRKRGLVARQRTSAVIVGLAAIPLVACSGLEGEGQDTVQKETAALYGGGSLAALWPNGDVHVCWEQGSDTGTLEGDGTSVPVNGPPLKQQVQSAIENGWGHAAKLRFIGWATCPSTTASGNPGTVAVHWETEMGPDSVEGYISSTWTRMRLDPNSGSLSADALHEFGHAIGFSHEQDRPDNYDSNGNPIFCSSGAIGAQTGGVFYTPGFDGSSIMSYCSGATTLSVGDIAGVQNAYGRKPPGSIVGPDNRCVDIPLTNGNVATGTQLQVYNCYGNGNQQFRRTASSQLFAPAYATNSYVDVRGAYPYDQGVVQAYQLNSPASANQQWVFNNAQVQGLGFQCATVPSSPGYANGTVLQLAGCTGTNQSWQIGPNNTTGNIHSGNFCWDVPGGSTADHTPIQLHSCNGGFTQTFTFTSAGQIKFYSKCIDVRPDTNGLQLYPCKSASDTSKENQLWNLRGRITSQMNPSGLCLDIRGGIANDNTPLQTYHCVNGAANQTWDYYFD